MYVCMCVCIYIYITMFIVVCVLFGVARMQLEPNVKVTSASVLSAPKSKNNECLTQPAVCCVARV